MRTRVAPALAYALGVFAVGFVLGSVRVLVVVRRLGEVAAVLLETPLILTACVFVARWVVRRWAVPPRLGARLAVGGLAFAVLMACELGVSLGPMGNTLAEHLARYAEPSGRIGLAGQLVFAALPALVERRASTGPRAGS